MLVHEGARVVEAEEQEVEEAGHVEAPVDVRRPLQGQVRHQHQQDAGAVERAVREALVRQQLVQRRVVTAVGRHGQWVRRFRLGAGWGRLLALSGHLPEDAGHISRAQSPILVHFGEICSRKPRVLHSTRQK